jgi:hypothetical protein
MRLFLFVVFLCLVSSSTVFAENANVSGNWNIYMDNRKLTVHIAYTSIYSSGAQEVQLHDYSTTSTEEWYPLIEVTQNSDGLLFGGYAPEEEGVPGDDYYSYDFRTLTGTVSGNSVTFQITYFHEWDYKIDAPDAKNITKWNDQLNFLGTISGNTITGTFIHYHTYTSRCHALIGFLDDDTGI